MSGFVINLQVRAWGFWHRVAKAGGTSWYKYESVRLIAEPLGEAKIILTWITKALAQKGHNHSYRHLCAKPHGSALTYCEAHSHLWWIWVPSLLQHWPFCSRLSPEILGYRKRKASGETKVKVIVIQFFSLFFFTMLAFFNTQGWWMDHLTTMAKNELLSLLQFLITAITN